ncbi:N-acetylmuramoyl-L-alanine amidase-like domain-containing protein [Nocardia amamiensis]|uniref:N-acetylmuramoyl-L-alanine amidase-like domain-containing protein n=1 Tax=Nocardia TaxID=1817 RepID=UPI0033C108B6
MNTKAGGGQYLPDLPVVDRPMTYVPAAAVDDAVASQLRTGDYIGADPAGLDVTHVGIFVQTPNGPVFRNASSLAANNKVVDSPFFEYSRTVPGFDRPAPAVAQIAPCSRARATAEVRERTPSLP